MVIFYRIETEIITKLISVDKSTLIKSVVGHSIVTICINA